MKKKVFVLLVCGMMFLEQMAVFANGRSDANIQTEILESHQIVQIQEEVRQTVRDEEKYIDRFIVKYIDGKKKDSVEVKSASKKAYERAKKEKTKLRAALESKLENAELQEQNIFTEMICLEENLQKKAFDVKLFEFDRAEEAYEVIELDEAINPDVFEAEFLSQISDSIEYIQPDYRVELAAEIESVEPETELLIEEIEASVDETSNVVLELEEDLQEAWKISKGTGVVIALIDTGVDITHPALIEHMAEGYDFLNDCKLEYQSDQAMETSHGTHVAGILVKSAPEAQVLPLKVFESGRAYTSDIIEAITYAEKKGASIVNMSFGSKDNNQALREAMENSEMFFVCAAGNHRLNIDETPVYPAGFGLDNSISVAALNQDLGMSYFSNYGVENVDIAAWGRDVVSTVPGGDYGKKNGSSMAAGYVSAAAAMVVSHNGVGNLKGTLKRSAQKLSCLERKVADGNKLSFYGAVQEIVNNKILKVIPEEDFDVLGYEKTPEETWALFEDEDKIAIAAGEAHCLALKSDGTVWAWGWNMYGQVGNGTRNDVCQPTQVIGLTNIKAIAAGNNHSLALDNNGTVWAWGNNEKGKLGDGTTVTRELPVPITTLSENSVKGISAGMWHSLVVMEDGTVWAWGNGQRGRLGDGTNTDRAYPVKVSGVENVKEVSAGNDISLALKYDGTIWGWGDDLPGHVKDNIYSDVPVKLSGIYNTEILSSGFGTVYAGIEKGTGFMDAWGQGIFGMGKEWETFEMPQLIRRDKDALDEIPCMIDICFGTDHGVALQNEGTVWTWGYNTFGELGDGSTTDNFLMTKVSGVSEIQAVDAGDRFTIALRRDGTIWGWGSNYIGQLGLGEAFMEQLTPVQIASNTARGNARTLKFRETLTGTLNEYGEHRFYRFTPEKTADYEISVEVRRGGLEKKLYNSDWECLREGRDENGETFSCRLKAGNTYFLEIFGANGTELDMYHIYVDYWDDCGNDIESAVRISDMGILEHTINYPGDEDMFQFTPRKPGNYAFEAISDFIVYSYLYDSSGKQLSFHNNGNHLGNSTCKDDSYFVYTLMAGETYYIKVRAFLSSEIGDTQLKIGFADDYKNTFEEAFDISERYMSFGEIDYYGDTDVFKFIPKTSDIYTFTVNHLADTSFEKMEVFLYMKNQISKISQQDDMEIKLGTYMEAGETYYLKLYYQGEQTLGCYFTYVETPLTVTIE